jgi:hypothetical protein
VTKRSGQGAAKRVGADIETQHSAQTDEAENRDTAGKLAARADDGGSAEADLSRMISELNEVRMRLDALVRKLTHSAIDVPDSQDTVEDVERLRMRLLGKLDRVRERLVTRLDEERLAKDH